MWCRRSGSNRHGGYPPTVFETAASANSATPAFYWLVFYGAQEEVLTPPFYSVYGALEEILISFSGSLFFMVPRRRFELLRAFAHYPLKIARLPGSATPASFIAWDLRP